MGFGMNIVRRSPTYIALVVVALAAGLTALDVAVDGGGTLADRAVDFLDRLLLLGAVWLIATLVVQVSALERDSRKLHEGLGRMSAEAEDWRARSRRLLDGLSEAIGGQFQRWGLTAAEGDIAGLMLKGLSLKDIAILRRTSEATIRQQAQGIYRKSGLANRAELSAFFLDDLFDTAGAALTESPMDDAQPGGKALN